MYIRLSLASIRMRPLKRNIGEISDREITVILPFRNEYDNLKKTLPSLIKEIQNDRNSNLILVNSASNDFPPEAYRGLMENSGLASSIWEIISSSEPGKCIALNKAMQTANTSNLIINVDADIIIQEGTFKIFRSWFLDGKIGAVSGTETFSEKTEHPMGEYKLYSNKLRNYESSLWSTISLEGSLLAWDPERIGWENFDEDTNADDAQISFKSIISGHRSILDPSITFFDSRDAKRGSFRRLIRRSQGLSSQIIRNLKFGLRCKNKNMRHAYFSSLILYIVVPWCVLFILSFPGLFLLTDFEEITNNWAVSLSIAPSVFLYLSILTRTGKNLVLGSLASITGHVKALFGLKVNSWNPGMN